MSQYLRPDSDVAVSGASWYTVPGSSIFPSLYTAIQGAIPSDLDYVANGASFTGNYYEVALSDALTPVSGTHTVRYRAKRGTSRSISVLCELRDGSTVIASSTQAITTLWVTYSFVLTAGEIASITDYSDLRMRFTLTVDAGAFFQLSGAELELPDVINSSSSSSYIENWSSSSSISSSSISSSTSSTSTSYFC